MARGTKNTVLYSGPWVKGTNKANQIISVRGWVPHGVGLISISDSKFSKHGAQPGLKMKQLLCRVSKGRIVGKVKVRYSDVQNCEGCHDSLYFVSFEEHWVPNKDILSRCKGYALCFVLTILLLIAQSYV